MRKSGKYDIMEKRKMGAEKDGKGGEDKGGKEKYIMRGKNVTLCNEVERKEKRR